MDQLLKRETWSDGPGAPRSVIYFCGTITDAVPTPPFSDHAFPTAQDERIKEVSLTWFDSNLGTLYPAACQRGTPQLEWGLLVPHSETKGEARFDTQYWHINIDPSERYVLSLPNSAQYPSARTRVRVHKPVPRGRLAPHRHQRWLCGGGSNGWPAGLAGDDRISQDNCRRRSLTDVQRRQPSAMMAAAACSPPSTAPSTLPTSYPLRTQSPAMSRFAYPVSFARRRYCSVPFWICV